MFESSTFINTGDGSKYLRHLCKHFNHKVEASWTDSEGEIHFDIGRCTLAANADTLSIHCCAEDEARLEELKEVIKSHFDRFARREHHVLDWPPV
ncbi:DUF2218 domain-containing protein [Oceanisphaera psychrotolerans]|uniref:2,4-dihydroxyhept-2-ene-1,7-dioic acid aldolase n=1 Tax=Oceanisphaera psychrotolerans TaxID=1414654 RepID=A0A1J4QHJ0_9GAMM|nr:DUF2218 domain-containing protein [Oceanisphaera psychrotolerans]OIN10442.1 hypothetical protein BFR47_12985 [Oceanisphaera psychrotolerans]